MNPQNKSFNKQNKEVYKLLMVTTSHTQVSVTHLAKNMYYFNLFSVNKLAAFNKKKTEGIRQNEK